MQTFTLGKDRVAVKVKRCDNRKHVYQVVAGTVCVVPSGTSVFELPDNYQIISDDNEQIQPSRMFVMTADTIDPYHLVIDYII